MRILFLLMPLMSFLAVAAPQAEIVTLRGSASYEGRPLALNQVIGGNGVLRVGDKSYVKIRLKDGGNTVALAANSEVQLNLDRPAMSDTVGLLKGYARWISGKVTNPPQAGILTKNAVMGVRGTDFMSLYNQDLGETEIWVFEGVVEFTNAANKADNKRVAKNQWGGIGGRFGSKCQEILTLTPELMEKIGSILPSR